MCPADGNALIVVHQHTQHLGIFIDFIALLACTLQLGIVFFDRCRNYNSIYFRAEVFGVMADPDICPFPAKGIRDLARHLV